MMSSLPLSPPVKPQLALSRKELPIGPDYVYEVKLDGFRCLAFVDGEEAFLQSRGGKTLSRYFPELELPPGRYVLDGEIVVRDGHGREDFDALGQRIHPAASRVKLLSEETPATYVAFDLLALEDDSLLELPFTERRAALEHLTAGDRFAAAPLELMVASADEAQARRWLQDAEGTIVEGALGSPTCRASARGCSRSSACARSTLSWSVGDRASTSTPSGL